MSDEKRTIFGYAPAPGQLPDKQPTGSPATPSQPGPQGMGQPPQAQQQPAGQPAQQPPSPQPPAGGPQPPPASPGPQPPMGQPPQAQQPPPGQPPRAYQPPPGQPPQAQQPPAGQPPQGMGRPPHVQQQPIAGAAPGQNFGPPQNFAPQPAPGPAMQPPMQPGMQPPMGPRPAVKGVSTAFYIGVIVLGLLLGVALTAWGATDRKVSELLMFSWIPLLVGLIFYYVLIYKAWAAINDGYARTTPGKAVGFMFIPFFNIYWMFVAIYGWSQDYNRFCQRQRIGAQPASEGLFLFHCIATLVLGIVTPITMILICLQMCRGINGVAGGGVPQAVARY